MGNNSNSKRKHYTRLLADNARALGYRNGMKLGKKNPQPVIKQTETKK